jgi:hypothetical protein
VRALQKGLDAEGRAEALNQMLAGASDWGDAELHALISAEALAPKLSAHFAATPAVAVADEPLVQPDPTGLTVRASRAHRRSTSGKVSKASASRATRESTLRTSAGD